jgi:hypothetical protein
MKNNQNFNRSTRKKLTLKFEHIIQLSSLQLNEVQGGSSAVEDSCDTGICIKPL